MNIFSLVVSILWISSQQNMINGDLTASWPLFNCPAARSPPNTFCWLDILEMSEYIRVAGIVATLPQYNPPEGILLLFTHHTEISLIP